MNLRCGKCHQQKPETEFYVNNSIARGRAYTCKTCVRQEYEQQRFSEQENDAYAAYTCVQCGKTFKVLKAALRKKSHINVGRFCSRKCARTHQTANGLVNTPHRRVANGYMFLHNPSIPGKRTAEHRAVAEKALGRKLNRDEVVHHINGNKLDNRNCNLLICGRKYHADLHMKMGDLYMKQQFGGI